MPRAGIVRQLISRAGSRPTISQVRDQPFLPTWFRPRKRTPTAGAVAPSTNSTSRHSWLHSPVRRGSPTTSHTSVGEASTTCVTVACFGIVPMACSSDAGGREHRTEQLEDLLAGLLGRRVSHQLARAAER